LYFLEQFSDLAYGRHSDKLPYVYLSTASPGEPNNKTSFWEGTVAAVNFSVERGFFDEPVTLELSSATPGAIIHYTTDSSTPTELSPIYTEPLTIEATTLVRTMAVHPKLIPSPVATHSYIFLDDVLAQSYTRLGFPKTWGTHSGQYEGYPKGNPVLADYEIDPEIVNDPQYKDTIKEDLKSIPTISLVTDMKHFVELYSNPEERGLRWEYPTSMELIDPTNAQAGFHINMGLRIQGDASRRPYMPKHSFRLFFRDKYGAASLNYPLFPDSPVTDFNTLTLRGGVNRSYAGFLDDDPKLTTYIRDEWLRASQIALSGFGSHGAFVHLYLNGLYWGLYNVVERPDAAFAASYWGGERTDWFAMNHSGPISGSDQRFKQFEQIFLNIGGSEGLIKPEQYAAVKPYLDIDHFNDYIIVNWYAGNIDWVRKNWYANVRNPSGRIRYFVWDAERIWIDGAQIVMDQRSEYPNKTRLLFHGLIQNPDFKMSFADRMYKHLSHNGALTDANSQARWLKISNMINRAIVGESARWGDQRYDTPISRDDWLKARDNVLDQMEGNAAKLIALARAMNYYPNLDPPTFNQQGGRIESGFELIMNSPQKDGSTVFYSLDGSDPRLEGNGEIATQAIVYHTPVVLTATTHIKARTFNGNIWSALNEATFKVGEQTTQLHITEIMYNPVGGSDYEFVELKNTGTQAIDLAGMMFEGINFTFPAGTPPLAPGEFIVLAGNAQAFAKRYPDVVPGGSYQAQLSNGGEEITLKDSQENVVISIKYDDEFGWPVSSDGRGDSLVLINLDGDPNDPENWRASSNLDGSPGIDEPMANGNHREK
jgi:hypothetical protein